MQLIQREADAPLSVPQAAVALNRSCTWVRDRLTMGLLEKDVSSTSRRIMVTARSVLLAKRAMPVASERSGAEFLRLVVDNSK